MIKKMKLYHTGYSIIESPDIYFGRKNADFGQGFYLSDDKKFVGKWARERKNESVYVNIYELDLHSLNVLRLERDEKWLSYIQENRRGKEDHYREYDVVIGPIANDTIYDVLGIITSGFLSFDESLTLMKLGPEYKQIVIKTKKAAEALKFLTAKELDKETLKESAKEIKAEEEKYMEIVSRKMESMF